jgi:hypothetical protein
MHSKYLDFMSSTHLDVNISFLQFLQYNHYTELNISHITCFESTKYLTFRTI